MELPVPAIAAQLHFVQSPRVAHCAHATVVLPFSQMLFRVSSRALPRTRDRGQSMQQRDHVPVPQDPQEREN